MTNTETKILELWTAMCDRIANSNADIHLSRTMVRGKHAPKDYPNRYCCNPKVVENLAIIYETCKTMGTFTAAAVYPKVKEKMSYQQLIYNLGFLSKLGVCIIGEDAEIREVELDNGLWKKYTTNNYIIVAVAD